MTPKINTVMPFAHLTAEGSESQPGPLAVRRQWRSVLQDSRRISALAYEHLSDNGPALDASYQMMRTLQSLLGPDDFKKALVFFKAAFGPLPPEQKERNSLLERTPHREMRASTKHLGEELSEELSVAYQMMYCMGHMLGDEGLPRFLTFIEAAYLCPDAEVA
jgi:hypothetical protein